MKVVFHAVLSSAIAAQGWMCSAQQVCTTIPLPPEPLSGMDLAVKDFKPVVKIPAEIHPLALTGAAMIAPAYPAKPTRVADSKFFLLNGIQLGMAVFDVEMTQRCIASHHCREVNPLMPSSHAGQLSINFAIVAYNSGISYWLKRRKSSVWWLPPSAGIAVHSVGVATGFEHQ